MITEFKTQFSNTAAMFDCIFTTKNHGEYEDYAQNYDYANASINLFPIQNYTSRRDISQSTFYKGTFEIYFLKKFVQSDNYENDKDVIIDELITLSEAFYNQLDDNQFELFSGYNFQWRADIIRQYTANLLCGIKVTIDFETACNRLDGVEPVPSLPIVIRNSDGTYSITVQTADSPFIIPDIRYQVTGGEVVQLPYTNQIIPIDALGEIVINFNDTPVDTATASPYDVYLVNTLGQPIGQEDGISIIIQG